MSEDTSIRVMKCSNCGKIVKERSNFCPYSSRKVDMDRLIIKEIDKGKDNLIISIVVPTMALGLLYENKNMYIAIFAFLILIAYLIFNIYIIFEAYRIAKLTTIKS
ncbi:MAG TPA: zinc ribbon domain-containing protein [Candidatus Methanoperedens sp.]|nr:zinc ribbon domain-containing protein [Candidatus Methanoperedens sp.]